MQKEFFSPRQAICVLAMCIFGSNVIMGVNSESKQDAWISLLLAIIITLPVFLVYARIMKLYPEKGLFDILEIVFGKIMGKVFTVLMTWYAIHLGALVLRNFSEFIQVVSMPETPQLALMITMLLVTIYLARSGVETYGKWAVFVLPIVIGVVFITILMSLKIMEFDNIMPVMEQDLGTIGKGAYGLCTFPFLETVLFLCLAGYVKKQDSPYKIYLIALLISGLILIAIILRNIEVIGSAMVSSEYFPSYMAARIISIGDYITRIEGSISMNFIFGGITKITICILAASKGMASLFNMKNDKQIIMPVSLIILSLSVIVYSNIMEMFAFIDIYKFYAIPFQIIIPLAVWITAEFKVKSDKKKKSAINSELQKNF